jgi:predicted RNA-binding protein
LYGEVRLEDTLAVLNSTEPNDDQAKLLRDGKEVLGCVLGGIPHNLAANVCLQNVTSGRLIVIISATGWRLAMLSKHFGIIYAKYSIES